VNFLVADIWPKQLFQGVKEQYNMNDIPFGYTPPASPDESELKRFLDKIDEEDEVETLVLFRDKDGKVHVISKKIDKFEGFWASIGLPKKLLREFGITIDANMKHVLQHLNEKKINDPRLKRIVERYNRKRRFGKIHMKDFPNLFPQT
jgi:hypothetical protein